MNNTMSYQKETCVMIIFLCCTVVGSYPQSTTNLYRATRLRGSDATTTTGGGGKAVVITR